MDRIDAGCLADCELNSLDACEHTEHFPLKHMFRTLADDAVAKIHDLLCVNEMYY